MPEKQLADIGVTGLAVMGRNLARNLARHGHKVALHNRSYGRTTSLVDEHGDEGTFIPSEKLEDFVQSLAKPRAIIIMVKAGGPTDAVIDELVPLLEPGDIVIDCGNAHFTDTRRAGSGASRAGAELRRRGRVRRRGGRAERSEHHAGRFREAYASSVPSSSRSPRTSTVSRAAFTSARTPPATSSRWCTTVSSTPTCS